MKNALVALAICAGVASTWLIWIDARYRVQMELSKSNLAMHAASKASEEVDRRFKQAVVMLHAKQYDNAVKSLHRVLEINPNMPEAYANMGFAMLGLKNFKAAHDFFEGAIELRATQANAYYGLGEALINLNDDEGSLGAMRTYVHLVGKDDPFVEKARIRIAELNEKLGRGK